MRDEFGFIQSIIPKKTYQSSLITGIGDDAALFQGNSKYEEVICLDTMVEGIHFKKNTMRPFHIGYKALAANISDLAAMGAIPTYYLVSIAVPKKGWNDAELDEIYQGMNALAEQYKMDLIGGDTVSTSSELVISITVMGRVEKNRHLLRSNASDGDIVFITGCLGDSAGGLELLLEKGLDYSYNEIEKTLIQAHQLPSPQVKMGRILAASGLRVSLNDISDGIASEANEIAEASNVKVVLEYEKLLMSEALLTYPNEKRENWVLFGGEDFQLIGTVPKTAWSEICEACKKAGQTIQTVGYIKKGEPQVILKKENEEKVLAKKGFNHFRTEE
ncbi:thiamine-phosphate kinase [Bacillus taeanensis]|uniref:Thiamine-monophosphate kinase n=1 Tax=Bacillus taeanensis TaxID=273032 RepID=A0A366XR24_9BACI|nr:thiamine-phosphate kinase [Bacillus taeanensis]RBW67575.1 thiamine-phosphate kinase [Bacillus taeanensis]